MISIKGRNFSVRSLTVVVFCKQWLAPAFFASLRRVSFIWVEYKTINGISFSWMSFSFIIHSIPFIKGMFISTKMMSGRSCLNILKDWNALWAWMHLIGPSNIWIASEKMKYSSSSSSIRRTFIISVKLLLNKSYQ